MATLTKQIDYYPIRLPRWSVTITILRVSDGLFFPVASICSALGVAGVQKQVTRLQKDSRFATHLQQLPVKGKRGARLAWCIRKHAAAWWVSEIDPTRVRPEVRDTLQEFQFALMEIADRLMFGDLRDVLDVNGAPVVFERPIRGELHFGCPSCGAPLCLVLENGSAHVIVGQTAEPPAIVGDRLSELPEDDDSDDSDEDDED